MLTFFLAMTLYPEIQRRAHRELHEVVGSDRLPKFSDRDSLPYINAIIKESLRWIIVTPLGVPHSATEEDVYKDRYFIPRGSLVIGNIWYVHNMQCFLLSALMSSGLSCMILLYILPRKSSDLNAT